MNTKIIASINLKGGVAKTTTTVGLAEVLSGTYEKKVLVIDLDPQTNATTVLIGDKKWFDLDRKGHTLATLFSDAIEGKETFDLEATLQKSVSDVKEARTIDLLPSSLQLIDLQDKLTLMPTGQFGMRNPVTILLRGIRGILKDYDYILIDCPPNLGHITMNGLRISDGYFIPTIPDVLSTYGIPQIVTRINKFSNEFQEDVDKAVLPLGIVATKYRDVLLHQQTLYLMRSRAGQVMEDSNLLFPMVFRTRFPESAQMAAAVNSKTNCGRCARSGDTPANMTRSRNSLKNL